MGIWRNRLEVPNWRLKSCDIVQLVRNASTIGVAAIRAEVHDEPLGKPNRDPLINPETSSLWFQESASGAIFMISAKKMRTPQ